MCKAGEYTIDPEVVEKNLIGGGGTVTWLFTAIKPGLMRVDLEYRPCWPQPSAKTERRIYRFVVNKK